MTNKNTMPAIPLEEGVPVVHGNDRGIVAIILRGDLEPGGEGAGVCWERYGYNGAEVTDSDALRVDLTKPAGFGYALRFYIQGLKRGFSYTAAIDRRLIQRHLDGLTNDNDRAQLAAALAEVM